MNSNTYFFVDGACLLGDIARLKKSNKTLNNKKLCLKSFYQHFGYENYTQFTGGGYKRFTVYFVNGEKRVKEQLLVPDFRIPNVVEDFHIKYCGKKITKSKRVDDWLTKNSPPQYMLDRFNKSEKAVDTQICCDALQLAANNKIDRLFLYTNDYDFMPLFDVLKSLGININMFRLTSDLINVELVENSDSFCTPKPESLNELFK